MQQNSRGLTLCLASIAALTSLSIDVSLPSVPAIETHFHIAAGRGALIMSVFLAGYAFTPLLGGPLSDRLGRRPVLLFSLALFTLSGLACGLAWSFPALLIFRLLQGCSAGVATTLPVAIVRDRFSGSSARRRLSEIATLNGLMPLVAPSLGSVGMWAAGWRSLFGLQALFAVCLLVVLYATLEESLPRKVAQPLRELSALQSYARLLRNRTFLNYALINGLGFGCIFSLVSSSPLIFIQRMGLSRAAYPAIFAVMALGTVLGSACSSALNARRASPRTIMAVGLGIMLAGSGAALAMALLGHSQAVPLVLFGVLVLFGFGLIVPSVTLAAIEPNPDLAGAGSGVLRSILMICGSGLSALLASYCGHHYAQAETLTTSAMAGATLLAAILFAAEVQRTAAAERLPEALIAE